MGKPRGRCGLPLQLRRAQGGKGAAASPPAARSGTSVTQLGSRNTVTTTHKVGDKGKEKGRRWSVETPSSLSLATVWGLHVGGTQMSMLRDTAGQRDVRRADSRDGRLAGALLPACRLSSRSGMFPAPCKERRASPSVPRGQGQVRNNTGYQPSTPSRREGGWEWLLALSWGNYTAWEAAGPLRDPGGLTHTHSVGKEKARRPEGITQPSTAGARPVLQEWNRPWV